MKRVGIIIPTWHPGKEFELLLEKLQSQQHKADHILIVNTDEKLWDKKIEEKFPEIRVEHVNKSEFDHGGTRKKAASLVDTEILMFMTQDALPENDLLIKKMAEAFEKDEKIAAVYARQLPTKDCSELERYTRAFNYPETSSVKTKADLPEYGIKTFFCSNVCAAYRKDIYEKLGGFVERTIFNEDMIFAGTLIDHDYAISYVSDARVIHSHNYTCMQQLHRNFDLGVSQAEHPEIFGGIVSEGEGIRLVKNMLVYFMKRGKWDMIPRVILQSGFKYIGFFLGKRYQKLPRFLILRLTMNRSYWQ